jgi:general secretion pathway protein H
MPISATGNRLEQGFTLVELMVVIAIMALATSVVALSLPPSNAHVRVQAEALAARMLAARDAAILEARDMAVVIDAGGNSIERRRRGAWQAAIGRPFARVEWRAGTQVRLASDRTRFVFDTTGMTTPATVTLADGAAQATIAISADGAIRVGS